MTAAHILVVDDEPLLLEILQENLEEAGYTTVAASSGEAAWKIITDNPGAFDTIILDRLMPDIDGIEVLIRIKNHPEISHVPVIMQTSLASDAEIAEGLKAGAMYYLTKPFSADALLAIVSHAVEDHQNYKALQEEVRKTGAMLQLLQQADFRFRTREEARALATLAAQAAPDPQRVVLGLSELLLNAVEHGNLGITYQEKTALLNSHAFEAEITKRLVFSDFADRRATLLIQRTEDALNFKVIDQGIGFDWSNYLEISPERAFDMHGRGIAMARMISFDKIRYEGTGNTVVASVQLTH